MTIDFYAPKNIIYGEGAFQQIVKNAKKLCMTYSMIFYSRSAFSIERKEMLKQQLIDANIKASFFEMPSGEPTLTLLKIAVKLFRENGCDSVVAIGGGSALDLAKAVSAMGNNPELEFATLGEQLSIKRVPFIAVPTTAGSGSEVSKIAVLIDDKKKIKYNPGHTDLIPDVAILDPTLTVNLPPRATAYAGMDALTHAIEAFVSTKANTLSDMYALQAIQYITKHLKTAYDQPTNIEARSGVLLGSYYAGLAFSNAATNLAHAAGRAIGTKWQLPHGQSVAILHPFVIDFSMDSATERYEQVVAACGLTSVRHLKDYLLQLNDALRIWDDLEVVQEQAFIDSIEELTEAALEGTGILTNRQLPTAEHIKQLYLALHHHVKGKYLVKH